ncbi:MAG: outer membrane lipoprotein-sorting protein [Arenicella sp.]|nr:outer membrane lipoprotein-sorting protein [Arenicella sp.]
MKINQLAVAVVGLLLSFYTLAQQESRPLNKASDEVLSVDANAIASQEMANNLATIDSSKEKKFSREQVEALVEHIENTMFPKTAVSTYKLQSLKNEKVIKEFSFEMSLEDNKSLLLMTWPAPAKPKVLLKSGKDLWMYFRDVKRSIRLSARDSFMGTDANNYDLMELNLLDDYELASFEEVTLNGETIIKAEMLAKKGTDGYSKVISWISPIEKRMLKNECFSISGAKIKTIEYNDLLKIDNYSVPGSVLISSAVRKDRTTLLTISNVRPKDDIDDLIFTLGYLESLD